MTGKASVLFQNPQWKKNIFKTPLFKLFFYVSEMKQRRQGCPPHQRYTCPCVRFTLLPYTDPAAACWKLHPALDSAKVLHRLSWHLPSHTRTPCLPRRKLRARWEVPGAAFLKQAYRSCVWGSPVNCQSSSYSESTLHAVLWNDTFSHGDHTWSPSCSHMATKAVLRDALFTSMILRTFTDRKPGWRVLEGDRMFTWRKKDLSACQEPKPFKPWPFWFFLFISSWLYWNPTPTHSAREHLLSKKNLMKTPRNTASWLNSFLKSFPEGGDLVLI